MQMSVKNSKIHLVIPMSGQGTRYQKMGYTEPKPAIPVNGISMIERLLKVFPIDWNTSFIMAENHINTPLPNLLKHIRPDGKQYFIEKNTLGPSFAVLPALKDLPDEASVLVSYCDYGMIWDPRCFEEFVKHSDCDASLVSYRGFHAHYLSQVNYAFSRIENENVLEVKEKGNFTSNRESEYASCGAYYFKSVKILKETIEYQMNQNLSMNGEYYTSLTIQAMLEKNPESDVRVYEIPYFFQWGTPQDLWDFEYWEKNYIHCSRTSKLSNKKDFNVEQILMPMAGLGSRFKDFTKKRKPFIKIEQQAMFQSALNCLPLAGKEVIVTLEEVKNEYENSLSEGVKIKTSRDVIYLNETPAGQALTVEAGLHALDLDKEVLVTACDHGLVIEPSKWKAFRKLNCDAAVFAIKGFPETRRRPLAYSYISVKNNDVDCFPYVNSIGVKKPFSDDASKDFLLVGSFWFKNGKILKQGIQDLKTKAQTVNGELYLDGIFDHLIAMGCDVRVFPLDGYMNWGDPNSLKESLYWKEVFMGHQLQPRGAYPGVEF